VGRAVRETHPPGVNGGVQEEDLNFNRGRKRAKQTAKKKKIPMIEETTGGSLWERGGLKTENRREENRNCTHLTEFPILAD